MKSLPLRLDHDITAVAFRGCPFCATPPVVFQVRDPRYLGMELSWVAQCPNPKCIMGTTQPMLFLTGLQRLWNHRIRRRGLDQTSP